MTTHTTFHRPAIATVLAVPLLLLTANDAEAQGRGRRGGADIEISAEITFSVGQRELIREFYSSNPHPATEGLPPGIRKNLVRGKPMPPGIAKKSPPPELRVALAVPQEFEVVEVGWDVLIVEVATGIIHDVLMDVIR